MSNYKVTFLLDKSNDWLSEYLEQTKWNRSKYNITISYDFKKVLNQDIVFILGYTKILDDNFLCQNKLNLVIHESSLPHGKGFAPLQWQILEGHNKIPIVLLEAASNVDTGDIILEDTIILDGKELYREIRSKQADVTINLIKKFLSIYPVFSRRKQIGEESFYSRRNKSDSEIDFKKTIESQFNLLRICNNEDWPAFFIHDGIKYYLKITKE